MLEYKRSLKARKLTLDQLPRKIQSKIAELSALEKNLIAAEEEENDSLVDELNTQFVKLDSTVADMIDEYEIPAPTPKPINPPAPPTKPIEKTDAETIPNPKNDNGTNVVVGVSILAAIGIGIAYFFGAGGKK
jgi:hypothetical protein